MKTYDKLYINGEWTDAAGEGTTEVINPASEAICGSVPCGNAVDVDRAVIAARAAFDSWSSTSAQERGEYIQAIADKLLERMPEIGSVIARELGSPIEFATQLHVGAPYAVMSSYAPRAAIMEESQQVGHSLVVREAVGVCAFINPWNYPLHQIVGKVAPALAAGCTMVVKPSQETPLNAFMLAEIMDEVGLPAGVFNLVSGPGRSVGEAMCVHPGVDMVSLTGSTGAGQRISELASGTIKRICLELGGKSANIILDDADLEAALQYNLVQVATNTGQTCIALTRTLVPAARYEEAKAIARAAAEAVVVGDPMSPGVLMGPMCSASQKKTVQDYIQKGLDEGASLIAGGLGAPEGLEQGFYVKPTVFADVNNQMSIAREEIFGPVLCLIPYETEQEAIEIANDSDFGLSGAVWSGDGERAVSVARQIRTGQVYINGAEFNPDAPFGGYKQSGNGRELGDAGMDEFIEIKAIQIPA